MSEYNDAGFIINGQRQINAAQNKIITAKIESQTILKDRIALEQQKNSVAGTHTRQKDAKTIESLEVNARANVRRRQQAETELEESVKTIEALEINAQANVRRRQQAEAKLEESFKRIQQAEKEVLYYKDLLSKPMHEIANKNENFKNTYVLQQQLLADWMVSQKGFKELAVDLGLQLGKTKEEILEQGVANKEKILNNTTKHNNNAEDSKIISPHIEALKNKIK